MTRSVQDQPTGMDACGNPEYTCAVCSRQCAGGLVACHRIICARCDEGMTQQAASELGTAWRRHDAGGCDGYGNCPTCTTEIDETLRLLSVVSAAATLALIAERYRLLMRDREQRTVDRYSGDNPTGIQMYAATTYGIWIDTPCCSPWENRQARSFALHRAEQLARPAIEIPLDAGRTPYRVQR